MGKDLRVELFPDMFKLDLQVDDQEDDYIQDQYSTISSRLCSYGSSVPLTPKTEEKAELQAAANSFKSARLRFQEQVRH